MSRSEPLSHGGTVRVTRPGRWDRRTQASTPAAGPGCAAPTRRTSVRHSDGRRPSAGLAREPSRYETRKESDRYGYAGIGPLQLISLAVTVMYRLADGTCRDRHLRSSPCRIDRNEPRNVCVGYIARTFLRGRQVSTQESAAVSCSSCDSFASSAAASF
jgi:hypothetical protein